uniref:Spore peptidoglycan hydrolase n=1 Tax=Clostridioides difficile TaxID=1496 RepID=A0A381I796_CLODI|nr:spore peptidoglycan hydrolase [Clostridioides difficile]
MVYQCHSLVLHYKLVLLGSMLEPYKNQLNAISNSYPAVPKVIEDGIYGTDTENAVKIFQGIFGLPQSGVVDFKTMV